MGAAIEPGRVFAGRYRLLERLGRGGFGEVWRARDLVLEREVAVKTVAVGDDGDVSRRFLREARALARLDHPNVVGVFDTGVDDGVGYLVMQLLSGPSLASLLAEEGSVSVERARELGAQAAAGLAAAHAAGLVHRDVSPSNLILDRGTLKLGDFGVVHLADATGGLTATGTIFATPGYVSPEQAEGRPADARSDLYALGCVLYALLTGEPPFTAEHPIGVVHQHLTSAPPPLAGVPADLDALVAALLAKDPRDRPASAAEVALRLRGESTGAVTVPLPVRRRGRAPYALLAAAVVLLALGAILAATMSGGSTPPRAATGTTTTPPPPPRTTPTTKVVSAPPPSTPAQALAAVQAAVVQADNSGTLDAATANDLQHRLADIAKALQHPNPNDSAHKVSDLLSQLGPNGPASVRAPLERLAALLPAPPRPPRGNDNRNGNGNGADGG